MNHVPGRPSRNMILWGAWGRLLRFARGPLGALGDLLGAFWGLTGLHGSLSRRPGTAQSFVGCMRG